EKDDFVICNISAEIFLTGLQDCRIYRIVFSSHLFLNTKHTKNHEMHEKRIVYDFRVLHV
ncbi:MAG: hypothetical protein LBE18_04965, partial [Planctomycetaceae bacterium]|nr:hypothetical protein [Planctomycetaceae bacterium]